MASLDFDPYEVLGVEKDAQEAQIVKAFRKAALKWHPDKNPEHKEKGEGGLRESEGSAEAMFLRISRALELLCDPAARAAYDRVVRTKAAQVAFLAQRRATEDGRRKRFREELEAREAAFAGQEQQTRQAARNLDKEIERLRREGSSLLKRECEKLATKMHAKKEAKLGHHPTTSHDSSARQEHREKTHARLRLTWPVGKDDDRNAGYTREGLQRILEQYGTVEVVISAKKNGSAIVEFADDVAALRAAQARLGFAHAPITVSWITPQPPEHRPTQSSSNTSGPPRNMTASEFEAYQERVLAEMMG